MLSLLLGYGNLNSNPHAGVQTLGLLSQLPSPLATTFNAHLRLEMSWAGRCVLPTVRRHAFSSHRAEVPWLFYCILWFFCNFRAMGSKQWEMQACVLLRSPGIRPHFSPAITMSPKAVLACPSAVLKQRYLNQTKSKRFTATYWQT